MTITQHTSGISSDCYQTFGYDDFDHDRVKEKVLSGCPVKSCGTPLAIVNYGESQLPYCPKHALRFHSNTFVYWNGSGRFKEAQLRNFPIQKDLAQKVALNSDKKAETHRLGYEMSEDALTWNVFVGLAVAGKLRKAVHYLTGLQVDAEPDLYLWGELVDIKTGGIERNRFGPLHDARDKFEKDIKHFQTEPDIMLVIDGQLVICIEAKFSSGNTLAHDAPEHEGEKPSSRSKLLQRYLAEASDETKGVIDRSKIGDVFHSQLFRNIIFASEMSKGMNWHVVNLVSQTQWDLKQDEKKSHYSFQTPEKYVKAYLKVDRFSFRTWEGLHQNVIKDDPSLQELDKYMRSKTAHYERAFELL